MVPPLEQGYSHGVVSAMAVFDDGSGSALYVAGQFTEAGGESANNIARWNGTSWSDVGGGMECPCQWTDLPSVQALIVFDDGSGSALYAGGEFEFAGGAPIAYVAKWNGSSWSAVGTGLEGVVEALTIYDDGTGPALLAAGTEVLPPGGGFAYYASIAKWDGSNWSRFAATDGEVFALAVFDDGSGTALYMSGSFMTIDGWPNPHTSIAKWNGSSWSAIGSPGAPLPETGLVPSQYAMQVFDDGSGPALYCGINDGLFAWDGASWSLVNATVGPVYAFTVFDDGTGPALHVGGGFIAAGGVSGADGVAKWDGSAWSALSGGTNGQVSALCVADIGSGPALFVGGIFTNAGGSSAENIGRWADCPGFAYCFGDGLDPLLTVECPCSNFGEPGHGCANSNSLLGGAELNATGTRNPNTLLLTCTGIPNGNLCTFLRSAGNNATGAVFGDGVSCISGALIRFGQQFAGQGWNEPNTVQAEPVTVAAGNTRYYAVQYRNPAPAFCPAGAFNVSNGYVIHW